jgi:cytochrome b561
MVTRYNPLAIILHWVMAIAFFLMLGSGLAMENLEIAPSLKFNLFQWHKSLGVLLLCTFFVRLAVRLFAEKPALPDAFSPREKKFARWGHRALYFWMIALPLTGWFIVSASVIGLPTIVFGQFIWPHIPNIAGNKQIEEIAETIHAGLAYTFIGLIFIHIAAVVKHARKDNINLLPRIWIGKHK